MFNLNLKIIMEKERIMSTLAKNGTLSLCEVCHIIHCNESNLILSLGQLIKENKVRILEYGGRILVEARASLSEIYY